MKNFKTINVAVCQWRHDIPQATDGAIFGTIIIEMNPKKLLTQAQDVLKNDYKIEKGDLVNLYITGLTMATVAIINACTMIGANLVCFHFDKDTGKYISQEVLWTESQKYSRQRDSSMNEYALIGTITV